MRSTVQQRRREHEERERGQHHPKWHNTMMHSVRANASHFAPTEKQKKGKLSGCVADQMKEVVSGDFYKATRHPKSLR
jgi:hypothetical protein